MTVAQGQIPDVNDKTSFGMHKMQTLIG